MNLEAWVAIVLVAAVALTLVLRRRGRQAPANLPARPLDTVMGWSPEAGRVLTLQERQAYLALRRALPDHIVLAQVPLSRFLKVPQRYSYAEWLGRVGYLTADLLVCDQSSQVLAVVEIHSPRDSERSRQRHARMARVLKAAGVRCVVWMEGAIPSPDQVREQLLPQLPTPAVRPEPPADPMPNLGGGRPGIEPIPVADAEEVDLEMATLRDPAPSTWFDDLDTAPTPLPHEKPR